jgi:hypothetical protein
VLGLIERHVIERVLRGKVWSGQVEVTGTDKELHEGILVKGVFQRPRGIREAAALYAPVPLVKAEAAAQDVILQV